LDTKTMCRNRNRENRERSVEQLVKKLENDVNSDSTRNSLVFRVALLNAAETGARPKGRRVARQHVDSNAHRLPGVGAYARSRKNDSACRPHACWRKLGKRIALLLQRNALENVRKTQARLKNAFCCCICSVAPKHPKTMICKSQSNGKTKLPTAPKK